MNQTLIYIILNSINFVQYKNHFIYLFSYLFIYFHIYLFIYFHIYLFIYFHIYLFIYFHIYLFIYVCMYLFIPSIRSGAFRQVAFRLFENMWRVIKMWHFSKLRFIKLKIIK